MTGMRMKKRIAAVLLSLLTLFSASCGVLEMREADPEPLPVTDRLKRPAELREEPGNRRKRRPENSFRVCSFTPSPKKKRWNPS